MLQCVLTIYNGDRLRIQGVVVRTWRWQAMCAEEWNYS